jgi:hypothetical protein
MNTISAECLRSETVCELQTKQAGNTACLASPFGLTYFMVLRFGDFPSRWHCFWVEGVMKLILFFSLQNGEMRLPIIEIALGTTSISTPCVWVYDLGTSWRWVVSFTPRPLYSRGRSLLDRRLGGPQSRPGRRGEEKILGPTGTWIQPVASRYTDYAIPADICIGVLIYLLRLI